MDRVLKGTAPTISVTFYVDGVATDPSPATATIEIDREDGTVLVAAGTATTHAGVGNFTYVLTPSQTAQLDQLTARWTATLGGQVQTLETQVEIVGGYLFSIADARRLKPLDDATTYPLANLLAARTLSEAALEHACEVPFVPRYAHEPIRDGEGGTELLVRPRPLSVLSATVGGTSIDTTQLKLYRDGRIYRAAGWMRGKANIDIKYTYGWPAPPPRVGRAALLLARRWLVESPLDDRTSRLRSRDIGEIDFLTAEGALFDLPEVLAVVQQYGLAVPFA